MMMNRARKPGNSRSLYPALQSNEESSRNSGERIACGVIGIRQPIDLLPIPQDTQSAMMNQRVLRPSF